MDAIASLNSICNKIGVSMIKSGGNAANAISMASTGLGGGGIALIKSSDGSYENVDFRETTLAAAFENMYNSNYNMSLFGSLANGIPKELRELEYIHQRYSRLSWQELIAPSINLARRGFPVNQDLVNMMKEISDPKFLLEDQGWSVDFAPNSTLLGVGNTITRKRLANLLERISKEGADAFYAGEVAKATIAALQAANGTMTMKDLKDYSVVSQPTLAITYRDYKIISSGAPTSGSIVLSVMKTIEGYGSMANLEFLELSTHRFVEAMRFGYGLRTQLGDPLFMDNITMFEKSIITKLMASRTRSKISDATSQPISSYDPLGIESLETHGTSHIVAADASGMAISLTSSINVLFGSRLIVPETGLILNNEMNDFSVPGFRRKRPQLSMSLVIVETSEGSFYFALGGVSGSYIITAVLQCLWNVLDRNMSLSQALEEPRFHDQLILNIINFEHSYNNDTTMSTAQRLHHIG
ncbi:gamma-glutamyltranspeptidase [Mollisia scopiformis]|uniref:Gamma-glutamyltranspeptidase n=1 Tax=Mollisia scopiformis TaxID=149040 RepID=A0A132B295_MOLSC|nr:gamma-glutamyltranspeptidase [Mollisia scopiformis]KUJ06159.1 gamma-glutamyltranspeptidase [Mollisia scopiformis]